jgi:glycosyltransferase involved in cell wall biosynthesis
MMQKTIIISTYNRAHLLRRILVSIANQSCSPDRVIVADDGSSEDMEVVIREEIHRLKCPITFVTQADDGFRLARSRNNAVRLADDGILIFADQDMLFTKDYFASLLSSMKEKRFFAGYMLRLDQKQTDRITDEMIESCNYSSLITEEQRKGSWHQYRKDGLYEWLYRFHLRPVGPKLRGGIFAVNKVDIERINGFDENYQGWGNEDDDLYWRLYASGVRGKNPQYTEYAIHQYHPIFRAAGERSNKKYFEQRKQEIMNGAWFCQQGLRNDKGDYFDISKVYYKRQNVE